MSINERSPAEKIPIEIIPHILQHLSTSDRKNARLVNSRWYEASRRWMFQKSVRFVFNGLLHKNQLGLVLKEIESFGYQYYDLEFHNEDFNLSVNEFLTFIKSNSLYIRRLSFQKCLFPFVMVEEIMINCVNLEELVFKNCPFHDFEEAILIPNFQGEIIRKKLTSLEMVKFYPITDNIWKVFCDIYPNVQRMCIGAYFNQRFVANFRHKIHRTNLSFLTKDIRYCFEDEFFDKLMLYPWIQFEEFTIPDGNDYSQHRYDKNDFEDFLFTQRNLKSFNVKWCPNFNVDSLELLFHHIPDLKRLNFPLQYEQDEAAINRVIELVANSKLEVLQLQLDKYYPLNLHSQKFCRNHHMYYLNISYKYRSSHVISDTLVMSLLKTFYNLTYLDVSRISMKGSSRDVVVSLIFRQQNQLRYLKANDCTWISDLAFKRCCLPKLEYLELKNTRIKHAAFNKFDFPKLKFLRLEECYRIPDESFTLLPSKCPLLQYLNVKGTRISEKTILKICENLKFLHCMVILKKKSPPIPDLDLISQLCPSLRFIQMGRFNHSCYENYYERGFGNVYAFNSFEKKWCKYMYRLEKAWLRYDAMSTRLPCIRCQPSKRRLKDSNF